jgi:ketosteroid isomerase-like protein
MHSVRVFIEFVEAINRHDAKAVAALMTVDHCFVDSLGNVVRGASTMETGWMGYFSMCPDYWIRIDTVMDKAGGVLAVGEAGGTIDGQSWRIPAAWQAVVRDDRVAEWRVFADNKPVYEIMAKRQSLNS